MKHTEGNWEYRTGAKGYIIETDNCTIGIAYTTILKSTPSDNEAKANAKLIAAAPDILKALIRLHEAFPSAASYSPTGEQRRAKIYAQLIIEKATE